MTHLQESMRFLVSRTSEWDDEQKPCEEAIEGMAQSWDIRTLPSAEAFDAKFGAREVWHSDDTTEHQAHVGPNGEKWIKRRRPDRKAWFVEFASLEEFVGFARRHGTVVVKESYGWPKQLEIEIYDDYRE